MGFCGRNGPWADRGLDLRADHRVPWELFSAMGNMGAELFEMAWVQAIVQFFFQFGWALYGVGLVVAVFECGIEY